jgi:pyruvate-formate lyase
MLDARPLHCPASSLRSYVHATNITMASSDGLAASSPLQDHTNQLTAPATLESMEEELTRLKSLLDSFSTRRGHGRGKRMR